MNYLTTQNELKVKNENDLPMHITFEQFQIVHSNLLGIDQLLWSLLWETGGRITAVLSIQWKDIDFNKMQMVLLVQKKKKFTTIIIPISNALKSELGNYRLSIKPKNEEFIFNSNSFNGEKSKSGRLTRQGAWKKVKVWGKKYLGFDNIHPHMMRHGLAIYLMSQNIPIPIISARLGHANVGITQNTYLVVTCELQRKLTENISWR